MTRARALLIAVLAAAVLAPSGSGGDGNPVVASASGASILDIENRFGFELIEVRPFAFTAHIRADGSVHGGYVYRTVDDGVPFLALGPITCAVIEGDRAWLGGLISRSSDESLEGLEMWFQVQDNSRPSRTGDPDMTTLIGAGGPGTAQEYCDDAPEVRFPFFLERGDVSVSDRR